MREQMKKQWNRVLAVTLICAMTLSLLPVSRSYAAALKKKSYDLAIAETLNAAFAVSGKSKGAVYTYSSSKKNVATVSKKGVVTAKAAGKAKITVFEKKKGKSKKKLGTITVTVHKAAAKAEAYYFTAQNGYYDKNPYQLELKNFIDYINPKAVYKWYSGDTDSLKVTTKGLITHVDVTEWKWIPLIIKETYQGKTRVVDKHSIRFTRPVLSVQERYDEKLDEWIEESKAALQVGQSFDTWDWIDRNSCVRFSCIWSEKICSQEEIIKLLASDDTADGKEDSFLTPVKDDRGCWTGKLTAQKAGMYYLYYVSYNYLEETYDNYFGCLTVEVME